MPRPAAILIPLLLLATAGASIVAWREHTQLDSQSLALRNAALLASENDTLSAALADARQQAANARNVLRRSQIERDVASIRELPFSSPVEYDVLDRASIRQVVAGKISEQYTDQEIANISTGLSAFGLLPPGFPLKQTYIDLLGEQIGAFYDQHQHKLFMYRDASLENAQNRVILAHELTHALQDQNFGLLKLPLEIKNNDDQAAAASALVEGDATLVMSQYMARDISWKTLTDTITYSVTQRMDQIRKAPHYLREMLVFPYIKGQLFCDAIYARGGFQALTDVYKHPPASTAQILHPEKYFAESREDPIPITFPNPVFRGRQPLVNNVLGEMSTRLLFEQDIDPDTAETDAAAWRGDRYIVFDQGKTLVWKSIWSSPGAAQAAAAALTKMCSRRFNLLWLSTAGNISGTSASHSAAFKFDKSNGFTFILAPDAGTLQALSDQFAGQ